MKIALCITAYVLFMTGVMAIMKSAPVVNRRKLQQVKKWHLARLSIFTSFRDDAINDGQNALRWMWETKILREETAINEIEEQIQDA